MNVTLSDIRLKRFLKSKFNIDLTHRIYLVENYYDLPLEFENKIPFSIFRRSLNTWGKMYVVKGNDVSYLLQNRKDYWYCMNNHLEQLELPEVYNKIGVPVFLGMSIDELYNLYKT